MTTPLRTKISLVLFGFLVFLILLEASLRLGGFFILSVQEYRNLQSMRHKGTYRIMCLGESTTAGQWPPYLEEALNQRNIGIRFSVIDKGVRATQTPAILADLESNLNACHPDMVVAMIGINDRGAHIPYEEASASKTAAFLRSLRTYKLARLLWLHIITKFISPANPATTEASLKKAVALDPLNNRGYIGLGQMYQAQGKFPEAEAAYKKAIARGPGNSDAYVGLGQMYQDQGRFFQAEDSYKKALESTPQNNWAYVGLGQLYQAQGRFSQAEEAFKKAIALQPRNSGADVGLGHLYQAQGRFSQAEDSYKKALESTPQNNWAYGALSVLYTETGRPEQARVYAEKASRLRPREFNPIAVQNYRRLADILEKKGIRLVCVQYPMISIDSLRKIFDNQKGNIIFVNNERIFRDAVKKDGYDAYFEDAFAGDFGHCAPRGNKLLAGNIADIILREVFHK